MGNVYGSDDAALAEVKEYKPSKDYKEQGDERTVRNLSFMYMVETTDGAGNSVLVPRDVPRGTVLTIDQMGLAALRRGETEHAFYTDEELDRIEGTGSEAPPVEADGDISELGAHELAEWLTNGKEGKAFNINDVLGRVGGDKDLAQRMLEAENIATNGEPRDGLVKGLTAVIEAEVQ